MAYPVYYVPAGDVLPIFFDTFDGGTGASVTLTGLAVTDIEIYKDGGTTQRASDNGYTLLDTDGIDFDGVTGIHGFSIDTGDNTTAGFYTVGAWFHVVVSSVTVDGQTVNFVAAAFRIMAAENVAGAPAADTTHAAGTAWGSGAITAASIASDAITAAKIATGAIDADAIADNAIDAGAIASNAITSAKVADGFITAAKFASGAIDATAIADNAIDAGAIASGAITSAKFAAGAITATVIATDAIDADALAADAIAEINATVDTAISDAALATASALSTVDGKVDTIDSNVDAILADTGTDGVVVASIAANAITATAIASNAITAAKIASDAITSAKVADGFITAAKIATDAIDADALAADAIAEINATVDTAISDAALATASALATVNTVVDAIKVTTDKLDDTLEDQGGGVYGFTEAALQEAPTGSGSGATAQEVWEYADRQLTALDEDVTTIDLNATTIGTVTNLTNKGDGSGFTAIPWNAAWDAEVQSEVTDGLNAYDPPTNTEMEARTLVAADYATAANLATVDTVVDAILADTGTDGVIVATNNDKTGYRLSSTGVDDIHDEAVEGSTTLRQSIRLHNAALGGKASGLETTEATYRDVGDTKDRIVATVDTDGNRTAITLDLT